MMLENARGRWRKTCERCSKSFTVDAGSQRSRCPACPTKKAEVILDWLRDETKRTKLPATVNVLDQRFVDHYIEKTGARCRLMPYGAHKCPDLGKTLSIMESAGTLDRSRAPITGGRGEGWPAWVYVYRLRDAEATL